jgi:hypothetical protein
MRWSGVWLWLGVAGCAWVTKDEFLEAWDKDGDQWPIGEDCVDDEGTGARIYPWAADYRGDGCDADCGTGRDRDGDDWPDDADCAPDDPAVYPCAGTETPGDGKDSDCDGSDGIRDEECDGADPDSEDGGVRFQLADCACKAPLFGECPGRVQGGGDQGG